jgi:hypothetical protein
MGAVRSLYGIDGPRRRPRTPAGDATSEEESASAGADAIVVAPDATSQTSASRLPSMSDLWRGESDESAERLRAADDLADPDARFDMLRIELEDALDRRIRVAVDQMRITFDHEIEALRTLNREEAKRLRSANDEAFVRIRVANTTELDRIKAAIGEGVARLCSVLEGQLDRVWAANDVELERIRAAGADRLAEVHDLLSHHLDQIRSEQAASSPSPEPAIPEPAAPPEQALAIDHAMTRGWLWRRRERAAH